MDKKYELLFINCSHISEIKLLQEKNSFSDGNSNIASSHHYVADYFPTKAQHRMFYYLLVIKPNYIILETITD